MKKNTDLPTRALYEANLDPKEFAPDKLGISYQLLRYRIRKQRLTLHDYHTIMHYTGRSFDELWPNPHSITHHPIKLNLSPIPSSVSRPTPVQKEIQPQQPVQQEPVASPSIFKIEDVYAGGLPSDEKETF